MSFKRDSATAEIDDHSAKRHHYKEESSEEEEIEEEDDDEEEEDDDEEEEEEDDSDSDTDANLTSVDLNQKKQEIMNVNRNLASTLVSDRAKVAREGGLDHATELLDKVNGLRDMASTFKLDQHFSVYDSRNLREVSNLMDLGMRSIKLGTTEKALRPEEFIKRLKTHLLLDSMNNEDGDDEDVSREDFLERPHEFREYNWFGLGTFLYSRGSKPISTSHLFGPLEIEKKIRRNAPRVRENFVNETTTAQNVTSEEVNSNSTNHTTNAVLECFRIFHTKARGLKINLFKFFINPHSFSQTIENMFYTSFLIRDGKLVLDEDEEGYPIIYELPPLPSDPKSRDKELSRRHEKPSNHIIFELEYSSWQKLVSKFNITESFIPTRS